MRYILVFATLFALGCNKNHDETHSSATSLTEASSSAIANFPSLEPTAWVNGLPVSLAEARGKNVVLIEAWHPA